MSTRRPAVREDLPTPVVGGSDGQRSSIVLGPRDRLKGALYVEGDLVVTGTVDGELEATGDVEIDGGGKVSGPVTARNRLVVGSSGSLIGDVTVAKLVVRDGASMLGNVSMLKPGEHKPPTVITVPSLPEPEVHASGNGNGSEAKAKGPVIADSKPLEPAKADSKLVDTSKASSERIEAALADTKQVPAPSDRPKAPAKPSKELDVLEVLRSRAKQNQRKKGRRR